MQSLIKYLAISRLLDLQMLPVGSETFFEIKKVVCKKMVSIFILKFVWSALSSRRIWYLLDTNILWILTSFMSIASLVLLNLLFLSIIIFQFSFPFLSKNLFWFWLFMIISTVFSWKFSIPVSSVLSCIFFLFFWKISLAILYIFSFLLFFFIIIFFIFLFLCCSFIF